MNDVLNEITYVQQAEAVIKDLDKKNKLTTTQIRKLMSLINDIYSNAINAEGGNTEAKDNLLKERLVYFKMRCIYEAGRDEKGVKEFIDKSNILNYIDHVVGVEKGQHDILLKKFITLFHYVEALVAYHRFYGGKDK